MMNTPKDDERAALDRLADALVEDILSASDEEILAEARRDTQSPEKMVAATRAVFERAMVAEGKARLANARAAVQRERQLGTSSVRSLSSQDARRQLQSVLTQDPELEKKLTLAARKGEGLSDEDVYGMLEDLEALGVIKPPGSDTEDR
jgi:hypothetical protein